MLVALGLPGLYARQAPQAGLTGLIGTVVSFFGLVFADPIHSVLEFTVVPVLAANPATRPVLDGPPPGLMGPLMIAIPVLLIAGFAISGPVPDGSPVSEVGPALLYLTMAAYGYVLAADQVRTRTVTERATAAPVNREQAPATR